MGEVFFFFFFFKFIVLGLICLWNFLNFFLGFSRNGLYMRLRLKFFFLAYKSKDNEKPRAKIKE